MCADVQADGFRVIQTPRTVQAREHTCACTSTRTRTNARPQMPAQILTQPHAQTHARMQAGLAVQYAQAVRQLDQAGAQHRSPSAKVDTWPASRLLKNRLAGGEEVKADGDWIMLAGDATRDPPPGRVEAEAMSDFWKDFGSRHVRQVEAGGPLPPARHADRAAHFVQVSACLLAHLG